MFMNISTDPKKVEDLLIRSIDQILPSKDQLRKELLSGRRLKVYIGADATGPALHIGHATNFIILEKFRQLGHEAILLIGDFTARVGDPTDKTAARKQLTKDEVKHNVAHWMQQVGHYVNLHDSVNPVRVVFNSTWFSTFTFEEVLELTACVTVQQMLVRDMFEKRMKENKPIFLHEFLYPLMQGFDSVALDVDIELSGRDQLFNSMMGRMLLKEKKGKEKFVMLSTILEHPVTKEKMMSKSLGTGIYITDTAEQMFGKVMSQMDENMWQLFTDCTALPMETIKILQEQVEQGVLHPRDCKIRLATEITRMIHGDIHANEAKKHFIHVFQEKNIPKNIPHVILPSPVKLSAFMLEKALVSSRTDFKRLLDQSGIRINGVVAKEDILLIPGTFTLLQKGKLCFFRIV